MIIESLQADSINETQRHKDTEAQRKPPLSNLDGGFLRASVSLCFSSNFHCGRTITEMIHLDVQLAQHGKQQIRHRGVLRIPEVPSAFEMARRTAGQNDGKWGVIVLIAVTHRTAIEHQGMVEKITVAIRRVL